MAKQRPEQELLGLFASDVTAAYSIHQIAQTLEKAYPHINQKVNSLIATGVLRRTVVGRAHLCSIDLQDPLARNLLARRAIERLRNHAANAQLRRALDVLASQRHAGAIRCTLLHDKQVIVILDRYEDRAVLDIPDTLKIEYHTIASWQERLLRSFEDCKDPLLLTGFEGYYALLADIDSALRERYSPLLR